MLNHYLRIEKYTIKIVADKALYDLYVEQQQLEYICSERGEGDYIILNVVEKQSIFADILFQMSLSRNV